MGEMKPTPGEWRAKQLGGYENPGWVILWPDKGGAHMRRIDYQGNFTESDARLIAEAGTVFHNTGLSPVQLVEQRDELMAACKKLVEWEAREKDHAIGFMERINLCEAAFQMMYAALAKCEGAK